MSEILEKLSEENKMFLLGKLIHLCYWRGYLRVDPTLTGAVIKKSMDEICKYIHKETGFEVMEYT